MQTSLEQFALSIAEPEPGCEYIWKSDPTWGQVPSGQICENPTSPYLIAGMIVGAILLVVIIGVLVRKRKGSRK